MRRSYLAVLAAALYLAVSPAAQAEPTATDPFTASQRSYWALQRVERQDPPASSNRQHPVDAFVVQKLLAKGLEPAPAADKVTLIRRASLDLIGLPPTPDEVAAFLADESPEAFENVIDRLLASPHYGERWGRHWLDLARYAESEGFKSDETRPNAWRYRDYVIDSFNRDKPYDRFVQEQIAGDEMWPNDPEARLATAFHRNYPDESNAANLAQRRAELLQDVTDAVGATFMGLTVGCAKCHDHKFDPILQKDYYSLQAFFANSAEDDNIVLLSEERHTDYKRRLAVWEEATDEIRAEMETLIEGKRKGVWAHLAYKRLPETQQALEKSQAQLEPFERQMFNKHLWQMRFAATDKGLAGKLRGEAQQRYRELEAELGRYSYLHPGEAPMASGMRDLGREAPPTHILGLANYAAPQAEVEPGFLSILDAKPASYVPPASLDSTGRRTALAKWLTEPDNPLTARVMANRIWHYHFGRGIVATPSDFGQMGERPTHPELLDWLTSEFIDQGWSVKKMHRLIMTSNAYQQSSDFREEANRVDPFNRLLWRREPQRLEGEAVRDSMLTVSGLLNPEVGGPSVYPPLPTGMPQPRGGWTTSYDPNEQRRRSIYVFVRRNKRYPMLESFDMPDTHATCARRDVTITAPQALSLLNDQQTIEWARGFAGRVIEEAGADRAKQVEHAYLLAYSRAPDPAEKDASYTFLDSQRRLIAERAAAGQRIAKPLLAADTVDEASGAALVDFCHALLNSNEMVYRY